MITDNVKNSKETKTIDLSDLGQFDVILADPPWRYSSPAALNIKNDTWRASAIIENHYDTMDIEEIKNIIIPASKNSMLFLWATSPLLPDALEVMGAWGYKYKTSAVWHKLPGNGIGAGLGFYFIIDHEFLLLGVRGNYGKPLPENRAKSVIESKKRTHSQKPDAVYQIIEQMFPDASKIELFARARREGWAAWGNQLNDTTQTTLKKIMIEG
jgi:N6-adenosine-specific RNA methylase IME4